MEQIESALPHVRTFDRNLQKPVAIPGSPVNDFHHVEGMVVDVPKISVHQVFAVSFGRDGIVVIIDVQQSPGQADKEVAGCFSRP